MRCILAVVAVVTGGAGRGAEPDAKARQLELLAGTWVLSEYEWAGRKGEIPAGHTMTMTFTKDGKLAVTATAEPDKEGTFEIDPSKAPGHFDTLTAPAGKEKAKSVGIYKLDGDTLVIAGVADKPGQKRPTAFDSKQAMVMTFTRKKS